MVNQSSRNILTNSCTSDALKTHRRDQFIGMHKILQQPYFPFKSGYLLTLDATEWIKGLLAVPFVLYSEPTGLLGDGDSTTKMMEEAHRRYAEIMRDVELMIDDHSAFSSRHDSCKTRKTCESQISNMTRSFQTRKRRSLPIKVTHARAYSRTLLHTAAP
jgi:hypothetical protein